MSFVLLDIEKYINLYDLGYFVLFMYYCFVF